MPEAHYIEIDEEIISAVSRLRHSKNAENIFVLPKRALILQSIINLKLLRREAEKLGKNISIMTQDEQGMRLAEKAGLRVQEYHDATLRQHRAETPARFTVHHGESIPMPEPSTSSDGRRRSAEIGSTNFYGSSSIQPAASSEYPAEKKLVHRPETPIQPSASLRIRNASSPILTSLNSKRTINQSPIATTAALPIPSLTSTSRPVEKPKAGQLPLERKEKLRRLYGGQTSTNDQIASRGDELRRVTPVPSSGSLPRESDVRGSVHWFWWLGAGVLLIGMIGAGYYFLQPTAIVALEAQTVTQTVKLSLVGTVTDGGDSNIPIRYIEQDKTIRLSREGTGSASGSGAKSSGTITIINAFSESTQPLVATTRFELSDGRIYRLAAGVVVPGMKTENGNTIPGKIDARVVADSAGSKYNISSGKFTIPGFKGSSKFEKITAETKGSLSGGSSGDATAGKSVSDVDLEAAKTAVVEEAKRLVIEELMLSLRDGEAVLTPSFQVSFVGVPTAPAVGTSVGEAFDYEARLKTKGFIINESVVRSTLDRQTTQSSGVTLRPVQYSVKYGTVLANYESKRVDLTVESEVLFQAPLDLDTLKRGLLGLDEDGIRQFLTQHPEIKRLQVEFKPELFIATIPSDPDRVTLNILDDETE